MDCAAACAGLKGHGGEVKSVDWHPTSSIFASGSRDAMVKLWDARISPDTAMLATLSGHKQAVNKVCGRPAGYVLCCVVLATSWVHDGYCQLVVRMAAAYVLVGQCQIVPVSPFPQSHWLWR